MLAAALGAVRVAAALLCGHFGCRGGGGGGRPGSGKKRSIRQHTSASVKKRSIRQLTRRRRRTPGQRQETQHTSASVKKRSIRQLTRRRRRTPGQRQETQHTSAYDMKHSIRQHTSRNAAYVSPTSAYVSIRQHTSAYAHRQYQLAGHRCVYANTCSSPTRQHTCRGGGGGGSEGGDAKERVLECLHLHACMRQHTSAYAG
jgi:hypothetical protein